MSDNVSLNPYELDGLTVREMNSVSGIVELGRLQHHCVGSYTDTVLDGHCIILAVEKEGQPRSTVELIIRRQLINVQHRAAWNHTPDDDDVLVVENFLEYANRNLSEKIEGYMKGLASARASAVMMHASSPRGWFNLISDMLPLKARNMGYQAVLDATIAHYENTRVKVQDPENDVADNIDEQFSL